MWIRSRRVRSVWKEAHWIVSFIVLIFGATTTAVFTQQTQNCTSFNFNPPSYLATFDASGGTGSVTCDKGLVSNGIYTGCSWVASPDVPWITIVSGSDSDQTGFGVVVYQVAVNASASPRSGTITFSSGQYGSAIYTVNQAGNPLTPTIEVPKIRNFSFSTATPAVIPPPQTLPIVGEGGASVSFGVFATTSAPLNWLSIDKSFDVTPTTLNVSVNPIGLPPGEYFGLITYQPSGSTYPYSARPRGVAVSPAPAHTAIVLTIGPQAPIIATPDQFTLNSVNAIQELQVTAQTANVPITATAVTIDGPDDLLTLDTTNGTTPALFDVGINPADAQAILVRPYLGIVTLVDNVTAAGKIVQVGVDAAPLGIASDPDSLTVTADFGGAPPPPQSISLTSPVPVSGTVSSDSPWLTVQPTSFTTPAVLSVRLNPATLPAGDYTGRLQVSTSTMNLGIPVEFHLQTPSTGGPARQIVSQIADGQDGLAHWKTTITVVNNDTVPASFQLNFWAGDGTPLFLPLAGVGGTVASYKDTIPVGGSRTIATTGTSSQLSQGWCEVVSQQQVGGLAIFRQRVAGKSDFEAASPIVPAAGGRFLLPFDNTQSFVTSMALVNPGTVAATVAVRIFDQYGNQLGSHSLPMNPRQQMAFQLIAKDKFPETANQVGVVEFQSADSLLAGLGLRFNPGGAFTSMAVLSSTDLSGSNRQWLAAQVADGVISGGGTWTTSIVALNGDVAPGLAFLDLYGDSGSPLALTFQGLGSIPASELLYTIPPTSSGSVSTTGVAAIEEGWVALHGARSLGGVAIFRQRVTGLPDFEAASPLVPYPINGFLVPFDKTVEDANGPGGFGTSIALVNPASVPAVVTLTLRDEDGNILSTTALPSLPAHGHTGFALAAPQFNGIDGIRGVAQFSCPSGVAGIGLRFNSGPFTSLPTIPR